MTQILLKIVSIVLLMYGFYLAGLGVVHSAGIASDLVIEGELENFSCLDKSSRAVFKLRKYGVHDEVLTLQRLGVGCSNYEGMLSFIGASIVVKIRSNEIFQVWAGETELLGASEFGYFIGKLIGALIAGALAGVVYLFASELSSREVSENRGKGQHKS